MKPYDVAIIGSGPAGIFAALEITAANPKARVAIFEKGKSIDRRLCPMAAQKVSCRSCPECAVLSGWGGAGAFSDGKLTLSTDVGGFLAEYVGVEQLKELIDYADRVYVRYGAPKKLYGPEGEHVEALRSLASRNELLYVPSLVRHIGTDRCAGLLKKIYTFLKPKTDTFFNSDVMNITVKNRTVTGLKLSDGTSVEARFVILAPGRVGSDWLEQEARRLKLSTVQNPIDIGVRVETPASVMEPLTSLTYEPKLIYYTKKFDDRVRTFCVNPYGEVVKEYVKGIWTVNGHSHSKSRTANTNFALLVSTTFTEPFNESIAYGRHISALANFLGKGVLVQRLGDLQAGRRSTPERIKKGIVQPTLLDSTPGDLSFVFPYRYLSDIMEMLEALDKIAPGVNSRHTLLYGVEVKFYSLRLKLTEALESEVKNLFAAGDGAGVTRGLIQASASGVHAAREILKRL